MDQKTGGRQHAPFSIHQRCSYPSAFDLHEHMAPDGNHYMMCYFGTFGKQGFCRRKVDIFLVLKLTSMEGTPVAGHGRLAGARNWHRGCHPLNKIYSINCRKKSEIIINYNHVGFFSDNLLPMASALPPGSCRLAVPHGRPAAVCQQHYMPETSLDATSKVCISGEGAPTQCKRAREPAV